ncbi:MAG: glycosyltransferase [Streptosporangiaceae bacterium]|jgi:glycosyltransferase involved in cell wall biosynthesis
MRILFVSPFPPARDGIGTYTQALMGALEARGHETQVVVPRQQEGDALGHLGDLAALNEAVRDWSPDLIHVQFAVAAYGTRTWTLLSWLRQIRTVPVIATMHEVTRDTASLRAPGRALYRKLAAQCQHVIVHTRNASETLTRRLGLREASVSVIPHPEARPPRAVSTPEDLRERYKLDDLEVLLAFGFVHVDKGLDDLVMALRIVGPSSLENVRLVIAGTVRSRRSLFRVFELRDRLHLARVLRMARRSGLGDTLVQTGYVPEADVAGWFQAASAVMLPYRRTEQSGVASLANAFGVPVLASTAGGLGEQYAASRWTFPPRSPEKLAEVLSRFLSTSPQDRASRRMAVADMDSIVEATLSVYEIPATVAKAGTLTDAP